MSRQFHELVHSERQRLIAEWAVVGQSDFVGDGVVFDSAPSVSVDEHRKHALQTMQSIK
jgi:hypothetical protein